MKGKIFWVAIVLILVVSIFLSASCFKINTCCPESAVTPASVPPVEPECTKNKCQPPPIIEDCKQIDYQKCCCEKASVFHYDGYGLNPDDNRYWRYIVKTDDDIVSITASFYSKQNWRWWSIVYLDNQIVCGFVNWWNSIWDSDLLYAGQILRIRKLEYITQAEIQDAIIKSYQHKYSFDHDYCRLGDGPEYSWLKEKGICEPSKPDWISREINSRCKQDCR